MSTTGYSGTPLPVELFSASLRGSSTPRWLMRN
jgi:hypothetical protein